MPFDSSIHSANHEFARRTREAYYLAEEGPKKQVAREHLRSAEIAERSNNEAGWILSVARAAHALERGLLGHDPAALS